MQDLISINYDWLMRILSSESDMYIAHNYNVIQKIYEILDTYDQESLIYEFLDDLQTIFVTEIIQRYLKKSECPPYSNTGGVNTVLELITNI